MKRITYRTWVLSEGRNSNHSTSHNYEIKVEIAIIKLQNKSRNNHYETPFIEIVESTKFITKFPLLWNSSFKFE